MQYWEECPKRVARRVSCHFRNLIPEIQQQPSSLDFGIDSYRNRTEIKIKVLDYRVGKDVAAHCRYPLARNCFIVTVEQELKIVADSYGFDFRITQVCQSAFYCSALRIHDVRLQINTNFR